MTEDDEFQLLEQRLNRQKEKEMYPPLKANDPKQPITLADVYNQKHDMEAEAEIERQLWNEHQVKVANARLKANDKQVAGEHYMKMDIEPWNVIDTWPVEQRIGFYRGNALKYIMRMGSKDERLQEIEKAGHYIEKLVEVLEEKRNG
jgi:hypothetical protein